MKINWNSIFAAFIVVIMLFAAAKCSAQFNPVDSIPIGWPSNDGLPGPGDSASVLLYNPATGDTISGYPGEWCLYVSIPITCPYARYDFPHMKYLHVQGVKVIGVFIWEPHPDTLRPEWQSWISTYISQVGGPNSWIMPQNVADSVRYSQPLTFAERVAHAVEIRDRYGLTFPVMVDGSDNGYFHSMSDGMPNRAVLVDPSGVICTVTPWYEGQDFDHVLEACMGPITAVTPPKLIVTKKRELLLHKGHGYKIVKLY